MQRLQPCLRGLSRTERDILVLRAGLGEARPRSRPEVARIAGISRRRVGRVEVAGLRRLTRLARASGCGASSAEGTVAPALIAGEPLPPGPGAGLARFAEIGALEPDGARQAPGIGVLGEQRTSTSGDRRASSSRGLDTPFTVPGTGGATAADLTIPLLLAMLLLGGLALVALRRRRARPRHEWDPSDPW